MGRSLAPNHAFGLDKKILVPKNEDFLAAVLGFEPRHTESESAVLPLHNTAIFSVPEYCITLVQGCQVFF